jgi:thiamine-phosphate pyrophosphorylase
MPGLRDLRRERLARARLYVVSGAREERGDLATFLESVLQAGADIVQLREKDAEAGDVLRWSAEFRAATNRHDALFVINDRPDVAVAAGADGVHLGQNDLPPAWARRVTGPDLLIGLSTHSAAEFDARAPEADYLCVGPLYATPTKSGRPATGLDIVAHAASRGRDGSERRPWFAIGGIDTGSLPGVVAAGAERVVVVRAAASSDPGAAVKALLTLLAGSWGIAADPTGFTGSRDGTA